MLISLQFGRAGRKAHYGRGSESVAGSGDRRMALYHSATAQKYEDCDIRLLKFNLSRAGLDAVDTKHRLGPNSQTWYFWNAST